MAAGMTIDNHHLAAIGTETGGVPMHRLHWKPMTWSLVVFTACTFVVCVVYGLLAPRGLHTPQLLESILPGFQWLSPISFILGLVESFLYGAYAGLVYTPIHNFFVRRFSAQGRG